MLFKLLLQHYPCILTIVTIATSTEITLSPVANKVILGQLCLVQIKGTPIMKLKCST